MNLAYKTYTFMERFYNRLKTQIIGKPCLRTAILFMASLLLTVGQLNAQEEGGCYEKNRSRGVAAMNKKEYDKAIGCFETAKVCPDKPSSNDLDAMIKKCEDAKKRISDYKKKAEETRKQQATEKRFQEEREQWELEQADIRDSLMAGYAYMNIIGCDYYNFSSGMLLSKDSDFLYAEDIVYLLPILNYDGIAEEEREVTLNCKLFGPEGNLLTDDDSPYGYSYSKVVTVEPGIGNHISLEPWGWHMTFIPGNYVLEIYTDSARRIHKSICSLAKKIPEVKTAKVTFEVDDENADIFVNIGGTKKGIFTGELEFGKQCMVECKKANHTSSYEEFIITKDMDGETFEIKAPQPILGSIEIESAPKQADIYIDGNFIGTTPLNVTEILIGEHQLRLSKKGFSDYVETIIVKEEDNPTLKFKMSR